MKHVLFHSIKYSARCFMLTFGSHHNTGYTYISAVPGPCTHGGWAVRTYTLAAIGMQSEATPAGAVHPLHGVLTVVTATQVSLAPGSHWNPHKAKHTHTHTHVGMIKMASSTCYIQWFPSMFFSNLHSL